MKIVDKIHMILCIILLSLFLPVLFCVVFIGNHMEYWDPMKLVTRLPNQILLLLALAGMVFCIFLFYKFVMKNFPFWVNQITKLVLGGVFIGLYFINVWIAKEICFNLGWDVMVVRGIAYKYAYEQSIGYYSYLSIYSNNIPICYILGRLLRRAMEIPNYPYAGDFLWIQVNCVLISLAGFFCCLTVMKLIRQIMPVVVAFFLYLTLVGISPWKIAPYTDTYGLIFPILCIYLYVCYRQARHMWSKWIYIVLAVTVGMAGGIVKTNLYIVVIALLMTEFISVLWDFRERWKFIAAEIILTAALVYASQLCMDYMIDEMGLEFNEEVEASWQHYFLMGLNEETTGGYCSGDLAIFGEFQTSKKDRTHAQLERAFERLRNRGAIGSTYFYLRKLVMTFNDALFGWKTEVGIYEDYPGDPASHTNLTQRLRSIFWGNDLGYDVGGYNTFCQMVWIFCLLGIPGICLSRSKKGIENTVFIILFLGIFLYQMLFEARSRYLFVFLPVLLIISVCGIWEYTGCVIPAVEKHFIKCRQRKNEQSMDDGE